MKTTHLIDWGYSASSKQELAAINFLFILKKFKIIHNFDLLNWHGLDRVEIMIEK
jgi:hypothetical protein